MPFHLASDYIGLWVTRAWAGSWFLTIALWECFFNAAPRLFFTIFFDTKCENN